MMIEMIVYSTNWMPQITATSTRIKSKHWKQKEEKIHEKKTLYPQIFYTVQRGRKKKSKIHTIQKYTTTTTSTTYRAINRVFYAWEQQEKAAEKTKKKELNILFAIHIPRHTHSHSHTYHMDNESVEQNMLFEIVHELYWRRGCCWCKWSIKKM